MNGLNKVQIIGRLGRDPETRTFQNGGKVCNLRIATTEKWKKDGQQQERTEWHSVAIFAEHAARFAEQYARKGALVYVEGKLETRKWQDQSGADRHTTEIVVRPYGGEFSILADGERRHDDTPRGDEPKQSQAPRDLEDEIPF